MEQRTIPMALRSKVKVCGRSAVGFAVSNPAEDMEIRPLRLLCVMQVAASATG